MHEECIVDQFTHEGVDVKIIVDPEPSSPREWDNLGLMMCHSRSYHLGDVSDVNGWTIGRIASWSWEEAEEWAREYGAAVVLALSTHESSYGISMGVETNPEERGFEGLIMDTPESREIMGFELDRFGRDGDILGHIREILEGEVETYNQYLQGDVYAYIVDDDESCFGFYGREDAESDAKAVAEWVAQRKREEVARKNAIAIARTATLAWNGEDIELRGTA